MLHQVISAKTLKRLKIRKIQIKLPVEAVPVRLALGELLGLDTAQAIVQLIQKQD